MYLFTVTIGQFVMIVAFGQLHELLSYTGTYLSQRKANYSCDKLYFVV
jgi:hypothetical protein